MIIPIILVLSISQASLAHVYTGYVDFGRDPYGPKKAFEYQGNYVPVATREGYINVSLFTDKEGQLRPLDWNSHEQRTPYKMVPGTQFNFELKTPDGPLEEIKSIHLQWESTEGGPCLGLFSEDENKGIIIKKLVLKQGDQDQAFCTTLQDEQVKLCSAVDLYPCHN